MTGLGGNNRPQACFIAEKSFLCEKSNLTGREDTGYLRAL